METRTAIYVIGTWGKRNNESPATSKEIARLLRGWDKC